MSEQDKKVKQFVETMTLKVISTGTLPENFELLKMLPSDIKSIQGKLGVNLMNANKRVNSLERLGLVKRYRGTGKVEPTELSEAVIQLKGVVLEKVNKNVLEMMEAEGILSASRKG